MRAAVAQRRLLSAAYTWNDVTAGRSVVEWAHQMIRDSQAADLAGGAPLSTSAQLRTVWLRLDPTLQRDVPEPLVGMTISSFMEQLDARCQQWSEIAARRRNSHPQGPQRGGQQRTDRPQNNLNRVSSQTSQIPTQTQFDTRGYERPNWNQYDQRQLPPSRPPPSNYPAPYHRQQNPLPQRQLQCRPLLPSIPENKDMLVESLIT